LPDAGKQAFAAPRREGKSIADELTLTTQKLSDTDIVYHKDVGGELLECQWWIIRLH
jgi:hypothetical protein